MPGFRFSGPVHGLIAAAIVLGVSGPSKAVDIQVDPSTRYQTLNGWESILSGFEVNESDGSYSSAWVQSAPKVMDYLVNEMGINRVRVELMSGVENPVDYFTQFQAGAIDYDGMKSHFYEKINDNGDPNVADPDRFHFGLVDFRIENELLPIKSAVEANGEKLYISVCYVDFNSGNQGSLHHGTTSAEYGELVTVFFEHLKAKYGIAPDAFEIILEPENTADWNDGGNVGRGAVAAATRLRAAGYDPEFIAPSTMSAGNAVPFFNAAIAVNGAANLFSMLSYHRYAAGDYAGIRDAARVRGIQTGMLEFFTASVDDLVEDLTVANVSAWEKYAIAAPNPTSDYAYLYANVSDPANPVVTFSVRAAQMMPYFRFARLGAVRVRATSDSGGVTPVAFVNTNDTHVLVVKGGGAPLTIRGLRDAVYGVRSVANDGRVTNVADITASGGVLDVTVPAGVTAIYDKNATRGGSGATSGAGGAPASGGAPSNGGAIDGGAFGGGAHGSGGAVAAGGTAASGGAAPGVGGRPSAAGSDNSSGRSSGGVTSSPDGGDNVGAIAKEDSGCACRLGEPVTPGRAPSTLLVAIALTVARARRRPLRTATSAPQGRG